MKRVEIVALIGAITIVAAVCHFGDEEIPVERYLELRKEIFKY